jgi:hypothetical protein
MTNYFAAVGARIPLVPNPNYDVAAYTNDSSYAIRLRWGPFVGTRATESDESGPTSFLDYWMDSWGVSLGAETDDFDNDGLDNWVEYANGSDPTDPSSVGTLPMLENDSGALSYHYLRRNDDSSLTYTVETTTNLVSGTWLPAGGTESVNVTAGELDKIMHSLPVDEPQSYFRLRMNQ